MLLFKECPKVIGLAWPVFGRMLNPDVYEIRSPLQSLALGGEVEVNGTVRFVKEAPCESTRNDRRCIYLHAESEADKAQVGKLLEKTTMARII